MVLLLTTVMMGLVVVLWMREGWRVGGCTLHNVVLFLFLFLSLCLLEEVEVVVVVMVAAEQRLPQPEAQSVLNALIPEKKPPPWEY